jgi:hypothetical protein
MGGPSPTSSRARRVANAVPASASWRISRGIRELAARLDVVSPAEDFDVGLTTDVMVP